jgi:hypothetical protein
MRLVTLLKVIFNITVLFAMFMFWSLVHDVNLILLKNGANCCFRASICTVLIAMSLIIVGLLFYVTWGKEKKHVREPLPIKNTFRG